MAFTEHSFQTRIPERCLGISLSSRPGGECPWFSGSWWQRVKRPLLFPLLFSSCCDITHACGFKYHERCQGLLSCSFGLTAPGLQNPEILSPFDIFLRLPTMRPSSSWCPARALSTSGTIVFPHGHPSPNILMFHSLVLLGSTVAQHHHHHPEWYPSSLSNQCGQTGLCRTQLSSHPCLSSKFSNSSSVL
jgi:hypothetical protein